MVGIHIKNGENTHDLRPLKNNSGIKLPKTKLIGFKFISNFK